MTSLAVHSRLRRLLARVREMSALQNELAERHLLLNRPWEEEFLHWGQDGCLHGHLVPPGHRRFSTTRSGWCIANRLDQSR
jgi:hypothetical protein